MKLKIANNLFILGNRVISYTTEVAQLQASKIVPNGKYSRTTTKQLHSLAARLGWSLQPTAKRGSYWPLAIGVQCSLEGAISPRGSALILDNLKRGVGLEQAALMALHKLGKADRTSAEQQLLRSGCSVEDLQFWREVGPTVGQLIG